MAVAESTPTVGTLVKARRQQLSMTQIVLGELIGKQQSYISALERNATEQPSREVLHLLAEALHMDVAPLYRAAGYLIELRIAEQRIPVIGRVPADTGRDAVRNELGRPLRYVGVAPEDVAGARSPFGLDVSDDGMRELGIFRGDVVFYDIPDGRPPRDRQLVWVRVGGEDMGLKRWCVTHRGVIELRDGSDRIVRTLGDPGQAEILGLYLTYRPGPR